VVSAKQVHDLPKRQASGQGIATRSFNLGVDLQAEMRRHRDINWSEFVRRALWDAVETLQGKKRGSK
jgi:hypothetical protein